MISAVKACKLLKKGCEGYWCCALEVKEEEMKIKGKRMICEFLDVVPEQLPRLPPQRETDFELNWYCERKLFLKLDTEWPQPS